MDLVNCCQWMRLELQHKSPLKCPSFSHTDYCVCVFLPPIVQDKCSMWWSWSCLSVTLSELACFIGRLSCTVSLQHSRINSQHPQRICPPSFRTSAGYLLHNIPPFLPTLTFRSTISFFYTEPSTEPGAVSVAKPTFCNSAPLNLHDSSDLAMFKRLKDSPLQQPYCFYFILYSYFTVAVSFFSNVFLKWYI